MPRRQIPSDWLDGNGHVNESRYLQLFSEATGVLERYIGIDADHRCNIGSYFTVETHLFHLRELCVGEWVEVVTQILGTDEKRLHLFHVLTRDGDEKPAAMGEQMLLHVNARSRRSGPVPEHIREGLLMLARLHANLPRPAQAGASIGLR
ncbi:thioesterase family protein [Nocardia sp. NPDC059246]|uniref:thioesterase family protein n=1 Tax=unclassified Nocardia TaxID=2637762 RepID=UPI0036CAEF6C